MELLWPALEWDDPTTAASSSRSLASVAVTPPPPPSSAREADYQEEDEQERSESSVRERRESVVHEEFDCCEQSPVTEVIEPSAVVASPWASWLSTHAELATSLVLAIEDPWQLLPTAATDQTNRRPPMKRQSSSTVNPLLLGRDAAETHSPQSAAPSSSEAVVVDDVAGEAQRARARAAHRKMDKIYFVWPEPEAEAECQPSTDVTDAGTGSVDGSFVRPRASSASPRKALKRPPLLLPAPMGHVTAAAVAAPAVKQAPLNEENFVNANEWIGVASAISAGRARASGRGSPIGSATRSLASGVPLVGMARDGISRDLSSRRTVESYRASSRASTSPTGKQHPDRSRRNELRLLDPHANILYYAPCGGPDNDRKMKEASFLPSQAYFESLRHYPVEGVSHDGEGSACGSARHSARYSARHSDRHSAQLAAGPGSPAANTPALTPAREVCYSGHTLSARSSNSSSDHIEADVRMRLGLACPEHEWRESQLHQPWAAEETGSALGRMLARSRRRMHRRSPAVARQAGERAAAHSQQRSWTSQGQGSASSPSIASSNSSTPRPLVTPPNEEARLFGMWRQGAKL